VFENRMCNFFNRFDYDHNGILEADDFNNIMNILDGVEGLTQDQISFANGIVKLGYNFFFQSISSDVGTFTKAIDARLTGNTFAFWANYVFAVFFIAVDADENGVVTWQEYKQVYLTLFDNNLDFATKSFNAADSDGSKTLTLCEYEVYATSYFVVSGTDDGSQYYWGTILPQCSS